MKLKLISLVFLLLISSTVKADNYYGVQGTAYYSNGTTPLTAGYNVAVTVIYRDFLNKQVVKPAVYTTTGNQGFYGVVVSTPDGITTCSIIVSVFGGTPQMPEIYGQITQGSCTPGEILMPGLVTDIAAPGHNGG